MPESKRRHTLAILRQTLGLTQRELANLLQCSQPTVQAVELGKLALSKKLAQRVADQTGVALDWLLENDVSRPVRPANGAHYSMAVFNQTQARLKKNASSPASAQTFSFLPHLVAQIAGARLAALQKQQGDLFDYQLGKAVAACLAEFAADNTFAAEYERSVAQIAEAASAKSAKAEAKKCLSQIVHAYHAKLLAPDGPDGLFQLCNPPDTN